MNSSSIESAPGLAEAVFDCEASGPLQGIRVVDLSRLVAGNMLSLQLADFGADVIKVESVDGGDTLRQWVVAHPDHPDKVDTWWQIYGRNKRSMAVDFRDSDARDALRRVIATAQVLIESFRPGTLEDMGFAPGELHALNPLLVIVRLSGWGQSGPYRTLPGFGSLIEGFSGYAMKNGTENQPPQLPNLALADMICGLTGAFATMTAIREVETNGGRGQVIDLSLLEPMLAIMGTDVSNFAATGKKTARGEKLASPRGSYRCRDGRWVALSGSSETMARRVFEAIGKEALFDDPRFSTNAARLANDAEIDHMIAAFIGTRDLATCLELFRSKKVTVGPVYDEAQLLADPHIIARQAYVAAKTSAATPPVVMHNITPRLSGSPGNLRRPAPRHGEHTDEVLAAAGLDATTVAALRRKGAIA
jgi:crotonobetainyl-CoA:carnitine CoA-transferase CaiB-like acyl-CoA transferase